MAIVDLNLLLDFESDQNLQSKLESKLNQQWWIDLGWKIAIISLVLFNVVLFNVAIPFGWWLFYHLMEHVHKKLTTFNLLKVFKILKLKWHQDQISWSSHKNKKKIWLWLGANKFLFEGRPIGPIFQPKITMDLFTF